MPLPENMIVDSLKGKEKAFQSIAHSHEAEPTAIQAIQCDRCKFDVRESSLEEKLKELSKDSKHTVRGITATIKKLTVVRGRYNDVIGWSIQWS